MKRQERTLKADVDVLEQSAALEHQGKKRKKKKGDDQEKAEKHCCMKAAHCARPMCV